MRNREVFFVAVFSFLGNIFGLFFTVLIARDLPLVEYGIVAPLLYQLTLIGLAASSLQNVSAFDMAHFEETQSVAPIWHDRRLIDVSRVSLQVMVIAISIIWIGKTASYLTNASAIRHSLLLTYIPAAAITAIAMGRLQGLQKMVLVSALSAILALVKLLSYLLARSMGSTATVVVSSLCIAAYLGAWISLLGSAKKGAIRRASSGLHSIQIAAIGLLFWVATGLDVLFLNFTLNGRESGIYALASTIGRLALVPILFYAQRHFTEIVRKINGGNDVNSILIQGYKFGAFVFICSLVFLFLFGQFTFVNLLGNKGDGLNDLIMIYLFSLSPLIVGFQQLQISLIKPTPVILGSLIIITVGQFLPLVRFITSMHQLMAFEFVSNIIITVILVATNRRYSYAN